jgi:hypothetical protein
MARKLQNTNTPSHNLQPKRLSLPVLSFTGLNQSHHISNANIGQSPSSFCVPRACRIPATAFFTDKNTYRRPPHLYPFTQSTTNIMAESAIPTFKLVLVGDGGTGKVSHFSQEVVFSAT